jgi:hypothetical protein
VARGALDVVDRLRASGSMATWEEVAMREKEAQVDSHSVPAQKKAPRDVNCRNLTIGLDNAVDLFIDRMPVFGRTQWPILQRFRGCRVSILPPMRSFKQW